jgi:hypothetical protein
LIGGAVGRAGSLGVGSNAGIISAVGAGALVAGGGAEEAPFFSRPLNHQFGVRSKPALFRPLLLVFAEWITSNRAVACLPLAILDLPSVMTRSGRIMRRNFVSPEGQLSELPVSISEMEIAPNE